MDNLGYLVAAYSVVWVFLWVYLFFLHSRQTKIKQEIEILQRKVGSGKMSV